MQFDLVFKSATVVTSDAMDVADVGIKDGKIVEIGTISADRAAQARDCSGLLLMPGGIDTQVHFRDPGLTHKEDIESGSRAALHGGITSFLEMPNTKPETTTANALQNKLDRAAAVSWTNYGFFVGATPQNGADSAINEQLPGTPGIKVFMGSSTGDLLVDQDEHIQAVLRSGKRPVAFHAEDEARNVQRKALISANPSAVEHPFLRDAESARLATERLLKLCEMTRRHVHILHISTADEIPMIAHAKAKGLPVTCEVTPQHLWFSAPSAYEKLGPKAQMNPPIRSIEHNEAIWRGLLDGVFDVFGSDHAPHTVVEKALPYPQSPSGMPGVETILPVLLTFASQARLTYREIVNMLCERPASLYTIQKKGFIKAGYDADLVLIDPQKSWTVNEATLQSKCGWSPYHGERFTGSIEAVYLKGKLKLEHGTRIGSNEGQQLDFKPIG